MKRLVGWIVAALLLVTPVVLAQDAAADKQKAKEERIEEYLRQKEQRRLEKEARKQEKQARKAAEAAAAGEAEPAAGRNGDDKLPRELAQAQSAVRSSSIGSDPTIQRYLTLIDQQSANAYELAAFGNFVADAGMAREAEVYYDVALGLEQEDPVLWINYGTLLRQLGQLPGAQNAYARALTLNPNNATAHYNIGAVLDAQGKYEDAIEAYTVALMIDPSLGDPAVNPSAANNHRLIAVKLMLYQQQTGALGTPLIDVPQGRLPEDGDGSERSQND